MLVCSVFITESDDVKQAIMEDKSYSLNTGRKNTFAVLDYVFFIGTLVVSLLIGIFFGYRNRSKHSTKEVLLAGGKMHFIPVAMSLLASFMSAITLLGTPAEMYNFTTMYWYIGISYFFVMFMAAHIYIPIFYNLKVTSAYEVRYIIVSNLNMKIILYMPCS